MKKYTFTFRWWVGSQTEGGHGKSGRGSNKGEGTEDFLEKFRKEGREKVVHEKEARLVAEFCSLGKTQKQCIFVGRSEEKRKDNMATRKDRG